MRSISRYVSTFVPQLVLATLITAMFTANAAALANASGSKAPVAAPVTTNSAQASPAESASVTNATRVVTPTPEPHPLVLQSNPSFNKLLAVTLLTLAIALVLVFFLTHRRVRKNLRARTPLSER